MYARLTTGKARPGIGGEEGRRLWVEEAEPLLKEIDGLHAVYSGGNEDTNEVFTLLLFESKEASDAYASGDMRDRLLGVFRDAIAGGLSVTEYEVNYQFGV